MSTAVPQLVSATGHQVGPPTPVTICQLEDEFNALLNFYGQVKPNHVLELGTASGGSLYHFIRHTWPADLIVSVDLPDPDYPIDRDQISGWSQDRDMNVVLIAGSTHDPDVIDKIDELGAGTGYDFVFIDANHRYQHVKQDLADYWPMVTPNGYLCLHDIALKRNYEDGSEAGVRRLWAELRAQGHWQAEIRAAPDLDAYGIGVLRGHSEPLMA